MGGCRVGELGNVGLALAGIKLRARVTKCQGWTGRLRIVTKDSMSQGLF